MKKYSIFKVALAAFFLSTIVIIGCSKTALNSESLAGSEIVASSNGDGYGNPQFQECPGIEGDGEDPTSYHFTGSIVGLGNAGNREAVLQIVAYVEATPECRNPGNNKVVPGQSKIFEKSLCKTYALDNGRLDFNENTTPILESDFGKVCPNDKWNLDITNVSLLEWHIYVDGIEVRNNTGNVPCNFFPTRAYVACP